MAKRSFIASHALFYWPEIVANLRASEGLRVRARLADARDHNNSSPLRCVVSRPGAEVLARRRPDFGQDEIDRTVFFETLADMKFDGALSNCAFGWERGAEGGARSMRAEMRRYPGASWK